MLECWRGVPTERPSFAKLKAKCDAMLLSQEDNPYIQFNINATMPYYSAPTPAEGAACEQETGTAAPDVPVAVPLSLPSSNMVREEEDQEDGVEGLGTNSSNTYVQTPRASDVLVTFDLRVTTSTGELSHQRFSKELAQIEEETSEECLTQSDMSVSDDRGNIALDVSTEGAATEIHSIE